MIRRCSDREEARRIALELARQEARADGDPSEAVICAGLPWCDLQGLAAQQAMENGCPWCERVTVWPSGRQDVKKPGGA